MEGAGREAGEEKPGLENVNLLSIAGTWAGRELGLGWEESTGIKSNSRGGQEGSTGIGPQHMPSPALDSPAEDREEEAPDPRGSPALRRDPGPTSIMQILRKRHENNNNQSPFVHRQLQGGGQRSVPRGLGG